MCSYTSELETERQQFDLLREEKLDLEREYTERMNSMEVSALTHPEAEVLYSVYGAWLNGAARVGWHHPADSTLSSSRCGKQVHEWFVSLSLAHESPFPPVSHHLRVNCDVQVAHRSEMQKRESLYQGKIMEEVERYQSLQSDVDSQRAMWQKKRDAMTAAHRQYMTQLTGDYERRLEAARDRRRELEDEVVCASVAFSRSLFALLGFAWRCLAWCACTCV